MSSLSLNNCSVCYQPTHYWCSRCRKEWYCSSEHLETDWPNHKNSCTPPSTTSLHFSTPSHISTPSHASTTTFTMTPTPNSEVVVTAIHFSVTDEKARLIAVSCMPSPDLTTGPCPTPFVQPWFPDGRFSSLTLTQGLNQEPLRFPLQVWYDGDALSRGNPVNQSVYRVTSGQALRPWSGPVVVLKFSGSRRQGYSEASLNDLPALSAYFLGFK